VINSQEMISIVPTISLTLDMATNSNNHKIIISSTRETMVSTTTSTARANTPSVSIHRISTPDTHNSNVTSSSPVTSLARTNSTVPTAGSLATTDLK